VTRRFAACHGDSLALGRLERPLAFSKSLEPIPQVLFRFSGRSSSSLPRLTVICKRNATGGVALCVEMVVTQITAYQQFTWTLIDCQLALSLLKSPG
jgi:hypothetical protein